MRILFVHEVNYLEKPIFEMHEIPEHLAARGHEISFLYFQEADRGSGSRISRQSSGRLNLGGELTLVTLPALWTDRLFGRALYAMSCWPFLLLELLRRRPDVIFNYSVPTSGWQLTTIARTLGIPIIYRAIDVSHRIRASRLSGLIKMAESFVIKKSDWISCNNGQMLSYVREIGARVSCSSVDRPPLDLDLFSKKFSDAERKKLRDLLGIPKGKTVVTYMGSFFYFSGLPEVIKSIADHEEAVLLLIGSGEQDNELRDLVSHLRLQSKVIFTGPVPYLELPRYFAISDVGINPMEAALVSQTALPNKVLQYMAANLPIVSTDLPGLRSELGDSDALRLVSGPTRVWVEALDLIASISRGDLRVLNSHAIRQKFDVQKNLDTIEARLESLARAV